MTTNTSYPAHPTAVIDERCTIGKTSLSVLDLYLLFSNPARHHGWMSEYRHKQTIL